MQQSSGCKLQYEFCKCGRPRSPPPFHGHYHGTINSLTEIPFNQLSVISDVKKTYFTTVGVRCLRLM